MCSGRIEQRDGWRACHPSLCYKGLARRTGHAQGTSPGSMSQRRLDKNDQVRIPAAAIMGAGLVLIGAMAMAMYELFSFVEKRTTAWAHRGSQAS